MSGCAGTRVLVTGAASGLGRAMTQALSAGLLSPSIMGPPIVWLASADAAGVHDERIVATEFQEPGVRAQAARGR